MTKALVIGYGSIGRRHVRILSSLGCEVAIVSRRALTNVVHFADIAEAVKTFRPDYAVVANETSAHPAAVAALAAAGFRGRLLIEKPLGGEILQNDFAQCVVAYNLRFHPALAQLVAVLAGEMIVTMQVYCGQYLPNWRPGKDYRRSYSADASLGGGVLRDLSHELDYLLWIGGSCRRVAALGGSYGELKIKSDDCWALLLELERCPCASVQINYLDRPGRRHIIVNTKTHTYSADLMDATLVSDGKTQRFVVDGDETYRAQHNAILAGNTSNLCSLADGKRVMDLIAAVEKAARTRSWVSL